MEKINNKYTNFKNALNKLNEILIKIEFIDCNNVLYEIYRDSVIKRFEFCYDLFWKLLKLYLEKNFEEEVLSPKKIFNACFKYKIASEQELNLLLDMSDDRNLTSHTYDEDSCNNIVGKIKSYYNLMLKISNKITI